MNRPILDNHLHLDPKHGKGFTAVEEFANAGGTHMLIVNQPSWKFGIIPSEAADFRPVFDRTVSIANEASDILEGCAWPVLGVHPALLTRLVDQHDYTIETATHVMKSGIQEAGEYASRGPAVAIKSGRPHYEVSPEMWDAANDVLKHALSTAAEAGVAVQLHTEATQDLAEVHKWAGNAGITADQVVKHYASGRCKGVMPSVIARREELGSIAGTTEPFLMETDYLDDPDRPGAVLGPKTVPRRTKWLLEEGFESAVNRAHTTTPNLVYGINTALD